MENIENIEKSTVSAEETDLEESEMPFGSSDILSVGEEEDTEALEALEKLDEEESKMPDIDAPEEAKTAEASDGEKITRPDVDVVSVAFRSGGKAYYFDPGKLSPKLGEHVIVETARGVEYGTVRSPRHTVSAKEIVAPLKRVIRLATAKDAEINASNHEDELTAAILCKKKIRSHALKMKLVGAEYTFDRAKLTFYFTCESRVDFRDLVRDLASSFRTRIELRQVGIRDEARIMGGISLCGRTYCCSGFLTDFVQVSIKMAKEQNFSLNSAKATGACGRLMCCLHYEHEVYEEAIRVTPPVGTAVRTNDGEGTVCETRPLAGQVRVRYNDKNKEAPKWVSINELELADGISMPKTEHEQSARPQKKQQKRFDPILDKMLRSDGEEPQQRRPREGKPQKDGKPRDAKPQSGQGEKPQSVLADAEQKKAPGKKPHRRFFRPKKKGDGKPGGNNA